MILLDNIKNPIDLKSLKINNLQTLCSEIREYFIDTILKNGGHFAGNLGVVELTVALHYVFDFENDKIVWDVGHQSYIHKILTGRKEQLAHIREFGGISGFPKIAESKFDHFGTGHSSTSISAALGMAVAAKQKGENTRKMIAVAGDGALTGGVSFEALNNIVSTNANILVIINDNHIGIDPNTGAMDRHLQNIEASKENIFHNLSIPYSGPLDGHDIEKLVAALQNCKSIIGPQVLHVRTVKGKGYPPAEVEQTRWHSTSKFVKIESHAKTTKRKWQDVFADTLIDIASEHPNVVGITPAMLSGSSMIKALDKFPDRIFDVGIAEQHAITFAAGMATEGILPIVNIYSTFLQRAYDQVIHDVALQQLPVIICVDRAGLVGEDGPTHHGAFDIAYLRCIPEIIVSAPRNERELRELMYTAVNTNKPFSIRYPKGEGFLDGFTKENNTLPLGKAQLLKEGQTTALVATGIASTFSLEAANICKNNVAVYHFPFVKPLDLDMLRSISSQHANIITVEDGCISGGFGESVADALLQFGFKGQMTHLGIPDHFASHGDNAHLYHECGYSIPQIADVADKHL